MKFCAFLLAVCICISVLGFAEDEPPHHEDVTEAQLGTVHFPSSCLAAEQKPIERGVAMLHSFWYEEAEKQFQEIEKADPQCAIAHWGLAMSLWHQLWNRPDRPTLDRGAAELKQGRALPATPREKDYIAALSKFYEHPGRPYQKRATAYSNAMEKVSQKNPDDHEAAAFYALSLLASEPDNDKTNVNRKKAAAVLEKLFAEEPDHPGVAHYLIHTYDKPDMAKLGLPAARRYAQIAPAAPHAVHMPSHIFARLGMWPEDIDCNVRSIAATQKEAAEHMGGEGHQFHAMDFLVYAYLQTGREEDAQKIIDEVRAMPPMKDMYGMGFDPRLFALSAFPASYVLELHHWKEAEQLELISGASDYDQSVTLMARAIGAARSGNPAQAKKEIAQIEGIQRKLGSSREKDQRGYEGVDDELTEANAWLEHAQGHNDEAVRLLRTIADKEEGEAESSQGIPAHEMLGDMLLESHQPEQALAEYETSMKNDPGRFDSLYGAAQAAEQAGKHDKANEYYAAIVKNCEGANSQRAELKHAREVIEARAENHS
ncbi:MAG TPA: tetratricopeptide repeat protein [Terriglobales bacterium]|nr:tetratricopeptide repeat protein [Terriglobales bacterium]